MVIFHGYVSLPEGTRDFGPGILVKCPSLIRPSIRASGARFPWWSFQGLADGNPGQEVTVQDGNPFHWWIGKEHQGMKKDTRPGKWWFNGI